MILRLRSESMALPMEIWTRICSLACTDDGHSGRSLSLVSSYINGASSSVKLQSVKVVGVNQILAFASMLESIPHDRRRVRHLFLSNRDLGLFASVDHTPPRISNVTEEMGEGQRIATWGGLKLSAQQQPTPQARVVSEAYSRILRSVSSTLETLCVFFTIPAGRTHLFPPIDLPSLTTLSLYGPANPLSGRDSPLGICPSLRRLSLGGLQVYPDDLFGKIATMAPSLTHLRLSGPEDPRIFYDVQAAMGRDPQPPFLPTTSRKVSQLPPTMERVCLGADVRCGPRTEFRLAELACITMLGLLQEVSKEDERFFVVRQPRTVSLLYDEAEKAWNDGKGAWWTPGWPGLPSRLDYTPSDQGFGNVLDGVGVLCPDGQDASG
jgi:hypothetical protein